MATYLFSGAPQSSHPQLSSLSSLSTPNDPTNSSCRATKRPNPCDSILQLCFDCKGAPLSTYGHSNIIPPSHHHSMTHSGHSRLPIISTFLCLPLLVQLLFEIYKHLSSSLPSLHHVELPCSPARERARTGPCLLVAVYLNTPLFPFPFFNLGTAIIISLFLLFFAHLLAWWIIIHYTIKVVIVLFVSLMQ